METVESGKIMNFAKKAARWLFDILDESINKALQIKKDSEKDVEEKGVPGKSFIVETSKGAEIHVTLFSIEENEEKFLIRLEAENCKRYEKAPVTKKMLVDTVEDYAEWNKLGDVKSVFDATNETETDVSQKEEYTRTDLERLKDNLQNPQASTHIDVTLQKVVGAKEDSINLVAAKMNCSKLDAIFASEDLLNTAIDSDEFIEMIEEVPKSFRIEQLPESICISELQEVDTTGCYQDMLNAAILLLHNIQVVHWMACGKDFFTLHKELDDYIQDCRDQIDALAELCVQHTHTVNNPTDVCKCCDQQCVCPEDYDICTGFSIVKDCVKSYVCILNMYYCNLPSDEQSQLDEWISKWNKFTDYFISRLEVCK